MQLAELHAGAQVPTPLPHCLSLFPAVLIQVTAFLAQGIYLCAILLTYFKHLFDGCS